MQVVVESRLSRAEMAWREQYEEPDAVLGQLGTNSRLNWKLGWEVLGVLASSLMIFRTPWLIIPILWIPSTSNLTLLAYGSSTYLRRVQAEACKSSNENQDRYWVPHAYHLRNEYLDILPRGSVVSQSSLWTWYMFPTCLTHFSSFTMPRSRNYPALARRRKLSRSNTWSGTQDTSAPIHGFLCIHIQNWCNYHNGAYQACYVRPLFEHGAIAGTAVIRLNTHV